MQNTIVNSAAFVTVLTAALTTALAQHLTPQRETRNGVREPAFTGACRNVWTLLYKRRNAHKFTVEQVRELAVRKHWNVNNTVIEFYRWKKFNGYS